MNDTRRNSAGSRLRQVARDILTIAEHLDGGDELSGLEPRALPLADQTCELYAFGGKTAITTKLDLARYVYNARSLRDKYLPSDLLGEPAWDILLDLYISEKMQRPIQVTSACIAARVPPTTALRWIGTLVEAGYVRRIDSAMDKRRSFVRLTTLGLRTMDDYLSALLRLMADPQLSSRVDYAAAG